MHGNVRLVVSEYERTVIIELTDNGTGVEKENVSKIYSTDCFIIVVILDLKRGEFMARRGIRNYEANIFRTG